MDNANLSLGKHQLIEIKKYLENLRVSGSNHFIDVSNIRLYKHLMGSNPHLCESSVYIKYNVTTMKYDSFDSREVFVEIDKKGGVVSKGDVIVTQEFSQEKTLKNISIKQIVFENELVEVKLIGNELKFI